MKLLSMTVNGTTNLYTGFPFPFWIKKKQKNQLQTQPNNEQI